VQRADESGRGAQFAGGGDHVHQCRFGLWPGAGFQAAVRVDPQAFSRNTLGGFVQQLDDLVLGRYAG